MSTIVLYGICKNEFGLIKEFLDHVSGFGFDHIVITDTGSTDGTYEYLIAQEVYNPALSVFREDYETFAFDQARNDALNHAIAVANDPYALYLSIDIDQVINTRLNERLGDALRLITKQYGDAAIQLRYQHVYGRDANGNPTIMFSDERAHNGHAKMVWKYKCHELLVCSDAGTKLSSVTVPPEFYSIEHRQQHKDTRKTQYLQLLRDDYENGVRDGRTAYYYGRELYYNNDSACVLVLSDAIRKFVDEGIVNYPISANNLIAKYYRNNAQKEMALTTLMGYGQSSHGVGRHKSREWYALTMSVAASLNFNQMVRTLLEECPADDVYDFYDDRTITNAIIDSFKSTSL